MSETNEKIIEQVYEKAYQNEAEYGVCPQAVLAALHDYFDFIDLGIIKASHTLAGGVARCTDGSCGALSGGIMAISCKYGRSRDEFGEKTAAHQIGQDLSEALHDRFIREYGSVLCRDVQQKLFGRCFELRYQEEFDRFVEAGGHSDKCPAVTGKVARWTAELLLDGKISS